MSKRSLSPQVGVASNGAASVPQTAELYDAQTWTIKVDCDLQTDSIQHLNKPLTSFQ